jgi:hypothetical protein
MVVAGGGDGPGQRRVGLEPLHGHVADDELEVLGDLHVVEPDVDGVVCQRQAPSAGVAEQRPAGHAEGPGGLERPHDVAGVAAAGEDDEQVSRPGQHLQLLGEDGLVGDVVGQAGHDRLVGREGLDPQAAPLGVLGDTEEEVVGEVDGVGGAAAIAADEDLPALGPGAAQRHGQLVDLGQVEPLQPAPGGLHIGLQLLHRASPDRPDGSLSRGSAVGWTKQSQRHRKNIENSGI